jgi:hypothetical protein
MTRLTVFLTLACAGLACGIAIPHDLLVPPGIADTLVASAPATATSVADTVPEIAGPDEIPAGKPAWFAVTGVPSNSSAAFLPTACLDSDPSRVVEGNALFWVTSPGEYVLPGVVVNWETKRLIPLSKKVTVTGKDPSPNPQPTPEPDPPPVPGERFVLIVSETKDRTPQEAATLATLRRWLTDQKIQWRIIDPTTEAEWMKPHAAKLKEAGVKGTALVVFAQPTDSHPGAYLAVEPLPGRSQEAIARIEEALK